MVKNSTLIALFLLLNFTNFAQVSISEDDYNGFSSRSFMQFNNFMTVPTFSILHRNKATIEAISRSSNIAFEDASRLHTLSYSGKMRRNVGGGIAVFQQEIGVFKDFGAIANYAYQLKLAGNKKLTFGFNFFYSRRSLDNPRILSNVDDPLVTNYQDKPVVVFQPAATLSIGAFDVGLFFENLGDFNLKSSEFITDFGQKTISGHVAYTHSFKNMSGLFQNMSLRGLGVARKLKEDFSYAGNMLLELPKAGWLKLGYDKIFGLNAGFGINLNNNLGIGFSYEKQNNLGGTNEVGILYRFGRNKGRSLVSRNPKVEIILPEDTPVQIDSPRNEYEDPEHNDLSDELKTAQDSINSLHKKVDELLRLVKNQTSSKEIIREVIRDNTQTNRDQSLPRRSATPWRETTITRTGGGAGTMYYTAIEQFRSLARAKAEVAKYNRNKRNTYKARYVKDPKYNVYVVYIDRHAKKEDAERQKEEINGAVKQGREDEDAGNDLGIKEKTGSDRVYVMKITLGAQGETIRERKTQPPARIRQMKNPDGVIPAGFYIVANVFGKKAYADRFLDELEKDGIKAGYFINPETGYRHVYIFKTNNRSEAIKLYNNNLNGTYYNRKNIIEIK